MQSYDEETMAPAPGQALAKYVPVYHDESIFGANEGRTQMWAPEGEQDMMFRKTKGSSVMASGFICPCHGMMKLDGDAAKELMAEHGLELSSSLFPGSVSSFTTIEPGKNKDGYWAGKDVVRQSKEVLRIFEAMHPGQIGVFTFDNSTNHGVFPEGARVVGSGVNKNPGGKNAPGSTNVAPMADGWCESGGVRVEQKMHFPAAGVFKGTKEVLRERGLEAESMLRGSCDKKSRAADKLAGGACAPGEKCCCANVLKCQPDFLAQPTALEELLANAGHICRVLPKCHPELNPIESFWAAMKEHWCGVPLWLRGGCAGNSVKHKELNENETHV